MPRYSTAEDTDPDTQHPSLVASPADSPLPDSHSVHFNAFASTSNDLYGPLPVPPAHFPTTSLSLHPPHGTSVDNDDDDDDEDEEAWDEVDIPQAVDAAGQGGNSAAAQAAAAAAAAREGIEIVISKGGQKKGKGRAKNPGATLRERMIRQERHKVHVLCLMGMALVRNKWLNDAELQARLLSLVPAPLLSAFTSITRAAYPNPRDRSRLFDRALQDLISWFYRAWEVVPERDLRRRDTEEVERELRAWEEEFRKVVEREKRREEKVTAGKGDKKGKGKAKEGDDSAAPPAPSAATVEDRIPRWPWDETPLLSESKRNKLLSAQRERSSSSSSASAGQITRPFKSPSFPLGGPSSWEPLNPPPPSSSRSSRVPLALYAAASTLRGSHDLQAQLFTCLLRAVDVPARWVVSLQGVEWRSRSASSKKETGGKGKKAAGTKGAKGKGRGKMPVRGKGRKREASEDESTSSDEESSEEERGGRRKPPPPSSGTKKATRAPPKPVASSSRPAASSTKPSASSSQPKPKPKPSASSSSSSRKPAPTTSSSSALKKPKHETITLSSTASSASDTDGQASDGRGNKLGYVVPKVTLRGGSKPKGAKVAAWKKELELRRSASPDPDSAHLPPTQWSEAYTRYNKEWIPVDVARKRMRCRAIMEPRRGRNAAAGGEGNVLAYVVAFEEDGSAHDVTPRYAHSFSNITLRLRVPTSTAVRKANGGKDWFAGVVGRWGRGYQLNRDKEEEEELWKFQRNEPFPSSLGGFKNHPNYVLETHLHRDEALTPSAKPLGVFKGAHSVFRRSDVLAVKSRENWYRSGRLPREDEIPRKWVKQRAVTINNKRREEMARLEGIEETEQGLYSEDQTEVYVPPPVVDGKVPKNDFGNIDLFVPSMLPAGAVHLPSKVAAKCAKELGFDYAEAITGFEFRQRRANPVMAGVVVAEENAEAVQTAILTLEQSQLEKSLAKQQARVLKTWKKLIQGLRIRQRLMDQFGGDEGRVEGEMKEKGVALLAREDAKEVKGKKEKEAAPKKRKRTKREDEDEGEEDDRDYSGVAGDAPPPKTRKRLASSSNTIAADASPPISTTRTTRSTRSSAGTVAANGDSSTSLKVKLRLPPASSAGAAPPAVEANANEARSARPTRASAARARGRLKLEEEESAVEEEEDEEDVGEMVLVEPAPLSSTAGGGGGFVPDDPAASLPNGGGFLPPSVEADLSSAAQAGGFLPPVNDADVDPAKSTAISKPTEEPLGGGFLLEPEEAAATGQEEDDDYGFEYEDD
ncbi:hypothetical protein JCM8097_004491 [Rhodosporidiobolus ruineniae]